MMKQVRLNEYVNELLNEIAQTRKKLGSLNNKKQDIVAEQIIALHKKEVKQAEKRV